MIGDLPEADAAPPPNMLFVCKLNPVTSEEDLDIIFSRFGNITSCDIIRWLGSGRGGAGGVASSLCSPPACPRRFPVALCLPACSLASMALS